ncbi:hypothetical protein KSS87_008632 [Heliosperma pusillum]|nr:hypothetical protein KSS87_008632 [Heliosperma pusillum]
MVLNVRRKKQQACISESRRPSYVTSSLSVTQTGSNIPVKEKTEFKSSFDEYLKAMESIRADRDKTKDQKEGGGDIKKLKDVVFTKSAAKNPRQEESRMWKKSSVSNFDEKDKIYKRSNVVAAKPRPGGAFQERVVVSSQKEINHKRSKHHSSKNVSMDMTAVRSSTRVWKKSMSMDGMSNDNDLEMDHKRSKDYLSENVSMDMTAVRSSKHVWKKSMPMDGMSNDNDLEMDRKRSKDYSGENVLMDMTAVRSSKHVWKKSKPVDGMSNDNDLEMDCKRSKDYSSENVLMDMTAVRSSKHVWKKSKPVDGMSNDNDLEMDRKRSKDYSSENVLMDMTAVKSSKHVWKKSKPVDEMSNDDDLEMEKYIFQPSELNGDVQGSPRVSQREMEERIQKLALWLVLGLCLPVILGKMGNWRMVLQLVEWLQMQERYKSRKIGYVYTAALGVLGKARRPVEALNLFSSMQRHRSSYPDIVAYHSIAVTLGQAGHMKELFDVIDSMRSIPMNFKIEDIEDWDPRLEPDIVIYNAVLNACVTRKEWEGAFWVLQKLAEIDQQPSNTTYGLLMEVMLACGKYDLVHEFYRQMQASSAPNALTYRVLVNTLWREGKTEEAIAAVQEMESRGLVASASLYYDLARCLCSAGRCEEALMQVDKICKVASKPLVVTYTGLMQACFDSGSVEDGIFIFKHMQKHCSPNLVTCNMMLKAYLGHGMFTEARELFQKMMQSGQQGSRANSSITADIHTFRLMLDSCVKENRWDDFDYAYNQMLHHGHSFNTKRHLWMVLQASKAGKDEVVETTWRHLMKSKRVPPPALVKERFRLKMENDDLVAAIASVASHPSSHQKSFSKEAWLKLLEDNAHCFNKEALVHLIHEIDVSMSNSELPNLIYQNLRDSCAEFVGLEPITDSTQLNETPVKVCI